MAIKRPTKNRVMNTDPYRPLRVESYFLFFLYYRINKFIAVALIELIPRPAKLSSGSKVITYNVGIQTLSLIDS